MGFLIGRVEDHVSSDDGTTLAEFIAKALNAMESGDAPTMVPTARLDSVYEERNRLVALLARIHPSGIHPDSESGFGIVYIDSPMGQLSWHYPLRDDHLFRDLPYYAGKWNDHSSEEKHRRMESLIRTYDAQKMLGPVDRAGLAGLAAMEAALVPEPPVEEANMGWPGPRGHEKTLPTTYTDWLAGTDNDASGSSD